MHNELFMAILLGFLVVLQAWSFKHLPSDRWQFLAALPSEPLGRGAWRGVNLTYYGLFNALAVMLGLFLVMVLLGSLGVPFLYILGVSSAILAICLPATRIVAGWVEKKRHTFTGGGSAFVGILIAPWAALICSSFLRSRQGIEVPAIAILAAFTTAWSLGEIPGRLGCVSFGCCYGKPLSEMPPWIRRFMHGWAFRYRGKTKKAAYERHLEGEAVFPIQAVTCIVHTLIGSAGLYLYFKGEYAAAFLATLVGAQLWRVASEFFRADFRGVLRFTLYQRFALIASAYAVAISFWLGGSGPDGPRAAVAQGLANLWSPGPILFLQFLGLVVFLYLGRSRVTRSLMTFELIEKNL